MEFLLRLTVFLTIVATAVAWKAAAPEPEPEPLITPGFAAVIILAVCKPIATRHTRRHPRRTPLTRSRSGAAHAPYQVDDDDDLARAGLEGRPRTPRAAAASALFACAGVPRALCPS